MLRGYTRCFWSVNIYQVAYKNEMVTIVGNFVPK